MDEVLRCWVRVCQILVIISPILAHRRNAAFEGMGFYLGKAFDDTKPNDLWHEIMTVIPDNVVNWFQEDIFSKKMGALFTNYVRANEGELGELLLLLVMIRQRPPGWAKEVQSFIIRSSKNSFYLERVFSALRVEFKIGFSNEATRQELRRLSAMAVAKHETGAKHPSNTLVRRVANLLDEKSKDDKDRET